MYVNNYSQIKTEIPGQLTIPKETDPGILNPGRLDTLIIDQP